MLRSHALQTKETLTLKPSAFGSKAEFDDKFFKKMMAGTSILDSILSFGQEKQNKVLILHALQRAASGHGSCV